VQSSSALSLLRCRWWDSIPPSSSLNLSQRLYGITTILTFLYFTNYPNDRWFRKTSVRFLVLVGVMGWSWFAETCTHCHSGGLSLVSLPALSCTLRSKCPEGFWTLCTSQWPLLSYIAISSLRLVLCLRSSPLIGMTFCLFLLLTNQYRRSFKVLRFTAWLRN